MANALQLFGGVEPQYLDLGNALRSFVAGSEQKKTNALEQAMQAAGEKAAAGDFTGASGVALRAGDLNTGVKLQELGVAQKHKALTSLWAWGKNVKDPAVWQAGMERFGERTGQDMSEYLDPERGMTMLEADVLGADDFMKTRTDQANTRWERDYKNRSLEATTNSRENKLETVFTPDGQETRAIRDPDAPGGYRQVGGTKTPGRSAMDLTATDKKAILEADEAVMAGENVMGMLDRALELSPKALSGPTAQGRGYVASNLPDWMLPGDKAAGTATEELQNLVTAQALEQLKAVFGGMPTEGERKILIEIQGSVNKAPAVREEIFRRARGMADKRVKFSRERAAELRGGSFYSPDKASPPSSAGDGGTPVTIDGKTYVRDARGGWVER